MPVELALRVAMAAVGLAVYLDAARSHPRGRRRGMMLYAIVLAIFLVAATQTPPRESLIASWILGPVVFAGSLFG